MDHFLPPDHPYRSPSHEQLEPTDESHITLPSPAPVPTTDVSNEVTKSPPVEPTDESTITLPSLTPTRTDEVADEEPDLPGTNLIECNVNDVIAQATEDKFKIDTEYDSFEFLKGIVGTFAKAYNFEVRFGGKKIHCYRGYASDFDRDRDRASKEAKSRNRSSTMKCDCKWFIKWKYVVQVPEYSQNDHHPTTNTQQSKKIVITDIGKMHNNEPTLDDYVGK